ncbi:cytosine deaminase [Mesorhizobium huakuii]|uniref:amidohydrolase family protein n=1 Tax=Mesorhizobium huakuii TaxID=28104 RepID=UPI00235D4F16|nr:amidohydrolase family protein [Mesorhizobium huakuii]GLQ79010.1 cytosine deaminase [Mesorhizobium huakuii]
MREQTSLSEQTIFRNAKLADGSLADLFVTGGRFSAIAPAGKAPPADFAAVDPAIIDPAIIDLGGQLVVPAFVEGHIHLDTSFYGDAWRPHIPCTNGFDVRERVAFQARNLAAAAPMAERAKNQLELCIGNGSLAMRSHVMVDASVGLGHVETILAVREEYRDLIDIQLVAFPQSGILSSPGTAELLDEAMKLGCDLVGGLDPASFDRDVSGHLDVVFALAHKHGAGVDIHLHDGGALGLFQVEEIAARTKALGMAGHVAVSHAYGLGDIPADALAKAGTMLAAAGVAIMTNAPGNHAFPPVAALRQAGVTVFSGSDNIRDSWWPYGDGDMLNRANMIGYRSGFYEDRELEAAFDVVTHAGARALGLADHGIAVGASADFVAMPARHVPEAVVAVPKDRTVYRRGRAVARDGKVLAR